MAGISGRFLQAWRHPDFGDFVSRKTRSVRSSDLSALGARIAPPRRSRLGLGAMTISRVFAELTAGWETASLDPGH